jgi:hypothetical protein
MPPVPRAHFRFVKVPDSRPFDIAQGRLFANCAKDGPRTMVAGAGLNNLLKNSYSSSSKRAAAEAETDLEPLRYR